MPKGVGLLRNGKAVLFSLSLQGRGIELSVFYGESSKMLITLRQELGFISSSAGMTTTGGLFSPGIMFALHHLGASKYDFF